MDYAAHYERLIARARGRVLGGYSERHHVLPKSMGGSRKKENLVCLTPEEHYLAHQLLVHIYPESVSLIVAVRIMARRCSGNKAYGWIRRRHAEYLCVSMRGNNYALGNTLPPLSDEHRRIISAYNKGKALSPETRVKIGNANRGRKMPASAIARTAAANRGRIPTAEHREKVAASKRGKKRPPFSAEWKAKMAARQRGVPILPQTREKIAAAHQGMKHSEETKAKISASRLAYHERLRNGTA